MAFQASHIAQLVKYITAMQETQVLFMGQEDALEKEMATHSSILAWRILWTEEPGGLQSMGLQELNMTEWLNHSNILGQTNTFIITVISQNPGRTRGTIPLFTYFMIFFPINSRGRKNYK